MARLEFFVVSRSVSMDQSTNQASIFEILEEVHPSSFPSIIQSCVATSLWLKEPDDEGKDFQMILRITTPDEKVFELASDFRLTARRHRVTQRVEGLPVLKEGEFRFEAILNSKYVAKHIIDVSLGEPGQSIEVAAELDGDTQSEHS